MREVDEERKMEIRICLLMQAGGELAKSAFSRTVWWTLTKIQVLPWVRA